MALIGPLLGDTGHDTRVVPGGGRAAHIVLFPPCGEFTPGTAASRDGAPGAPGECRDVSRSRPSARHGDHSRHP